MKNAIDILVDISDNMEGNGKLFAQRVLNEEILPLIDFSQITGLKTFMASGPVCLVIRSVDLGINQRYEFEQKINNLPMPNSGSPISTAIRESVAELKKQDADTKRIIIVTAGVDTLAGSYLVAVNEAAAEGIQVSLVVINDNASVRSAAEAAAAAGKGAACFVSDATYNAADVRSEINKLGAALSGQAVAKPAQPAQPQQSAQPAQQASTSQTSSADQFASSQKQEEPKQSNDFFQNVREAVDDIKSEVRQKLQDGGIIDIDDFKSTFNETVKSVSETVSSIFEPIKEEKAEAKTEQFASSTSSDSTDSSEKAETESVDLAEIIAKNKESLNKLQAQATESISLLMESCTKAINDLQGKASAKINELMNDHNSSASNLMQKSAEAFNKLSEEKDAALDKVRQLIADDKAVIIHTDSELADKIEIKSQQFLNAHLQKKYPGRVKWMNENGDAQKGYDFLVEDNDFANVSHEYVIACKGILDDSKTFFMRQREWEACVKNARNYQIYVISKMNTAEPTLTIIDNLMDAIVSGKVVPCATANTKLKAGHVVLTIK
ncbi:MAG: DUF3883 domain-containing protein [Paludibacteraceae bacterium]|nr:DUF3883 domain-containing protein [Paludibacteraceae bacterium]